MSGGVWRRMLRSVITCSGDITQRGYFLRRDVESGGDLSFEAGGAINDFGDPFGLVGGQGVHGVEQDGFNAGLSGLLAAMFQQGNEESIRFCRSRCRGHDGGLIVGRAEAIEGAFLV